MQNDRTPMLRVERPNLGFNRALRIRNQACIPVGADLLVAELAPHLLAECGVGVVCAAQLLVSSRAHEERGLVRGPCWHQPRRCLERQTATPRLNRGGDRQLNWALHVIALQRVRYHTETREYYQRLLAAGKTTREAKRCIKRALARRLYHQLRPLPQTPLTT
jgi:transposase